MFAKLCVFQASPPIVSRKSSKKIRLLGSPYHSSFIMQYRYKLFFAVFVMPMTALVLSLCWGRYPLSFVQIISVLCRSSNLTAADTAAYTIFMNIRLPRTLFVFIAGGAIGLSGVCLQSLFRNPLVAPDIIGVSTGASLGAAIGIVLLHAGPAGIQACAFAGGLVATFLVLNLSNAGGEHSLIRLVLAGVIINALAGSGVSLIKYTADPLNELPALEFWLMGCFNIITWNKLSIFFPIAVLGCSFIVLFRRQLNILSLGDEEAASLGTPVKKMRMLFIGASTLLVASVVSAAGIISWIGLIAPHVIRILFGNNNFKTAPLSFICGASLLLIADTFARSVTGNEIPISIITALIGAPILARLMTRRSSDIWTGI